MASTLQDFKAELFRTMANPVRIRILEALRLEGSLTVSDLCDRVGAEPSNVSQHLGIMRSQGVLTTRREGTSIWYSVAEPELFEMLDSARRIFERQLSQRASLIEGQ